MKQLYFTGAEGLFLGNDTVRKYSFKAINSGDSYALLAMANRHLAHCFAVAGVESAHFYIQDCFECLSPHNIAA